jgi:putative ABC transport system substrate-binding protein
MKSRRAALLILIALGVLVVPLVAEAQPAGKVYRLGYLGINRPPPGSLSPGPEPFLTTLRELGYAEGKNLVVERRWSEGRPERYPEFAAELVALRVDAIVTSGMPPALAAKQATSTIPIIMAVSEDPVGAGLAASRTRPGGNVTGFTRDVGREVMLKTLQLLREAVPSVSRVGLLIHPESNHGIEQSQAAAAGLKIALHPLGIRTADDISKAFTALPRQDLNALLVLGNVVAATHRRLIVELGATHKTPAIYWWRQPLVEGRLISYGPDFAELWRGAAGYVDKIFRGAKPGELPIQQPTKFELAINLKTAKALGLTHHPAVAATASGSGH